MKIHPYAVVILAQRFIQSETEHFDRQFYSYLPLKNGIVGNVFTLAKHMSGKEILFKDFPFEIGKEIKVQIPKSYYNGVTTSTSYTVIGGTIVDIYETENGIVVAIGD
jgi:hypothetical protein